MPFTPDSLSTVETRNVAAMSTRFPTRDTSKTGFLGKLALAIAMAVWGLLQSLARIALDAIPQSGSTYAALSQWATTLGLPDGTGVAGSYGPLKATAATGQGSRVAGAPPAGRRVPARWCCSSR